MKIQFLKRGISFAAAVVMLFPAHTALASTWTDAAPGSSMVWRQSEVIDKLNEVLEKLSKPPAPSTVSINMISQNPAPVSQPDINSGAGKVQMDSTGASVHTFASGFTWDIPAPGAYSVPSGFSANPADLQNGYDMPYVIGVDITNQVVSVVALGTNGQYNRLIRQFICSTGVANDPTPLGIHYLSEGSRNDWAYFKTYDCYVRYPVRIYGNYFFHSLLYSKQNVDSLKSSSYRNLGTRASHGCIRMLDEEVRWVSENCHEGTAVVIFEGDLNTDLNLSLKP